MALTDREREIFYDGYEAALRKYTTMRHPSTESFTCECSDEDKQCDCGAGYMACGKCGCAGCGRKCCPGCGWHMCTDWCEEDLL